MRRNVNEVEQSLREALAQLVVLVEEIPYLLSNLKSIPRTVRNGPVIYSISKMEKALSNLPAAANDLLKERDALQVKSRKLKVTLEKIKIIAEREPEYDPKRNEDAAAANNLDHAVSEMMHLAADALAGEGEES